MNLTISSIAISLGWAAGAAVLAWLISWPARRRSATGLILSVALTGTAASTGALLGAVRSMLLPTSDTVEVLLLAAVAGALGLTGAALAARRITKEHREIVVGLSELEAGRMPSVATVSGTTRQLHLQLERTAVALTESRERERALEHARRELVAWMSHDLRTPLAGLKAMTEALEDDVASDPGSYYKQMGLAVDRLGSMVDDLLELSRVQAGAFGREIEPISLRDLVSDCVASLEPLANAKQIEIVGPVESGAMVNGSVAELNRALTNVLANAIRHTPESGRVEVRLATPTVGEAELCILDECGGIDAEALARVFDPGYRGGPARQADDGGAGLGLAISQGIVEAHRGRVLVENVGPGCQFRFVLPTA